MQKDGLRIERANTSLVIPCRSGWSLYTTGHLHTSMFATEFSLDSGIAESVLQSLFGLEFGLPAIIHLS